MIEYNIILLIVMKKRGYNMITPSMLLILKKENMESILSKSLMVL